MSDAIRVAVDRAMARATAPDADEGDGWATTAAVLAYEVQRLRDLLDEHEQEREAAERRGRGCTPFCKGPCDWSCPNYQAQLDGALKATLPADWFPDGRTP